MLEDALFGASSLGLAASLLRAVLALLDVAALVFVASRRRALYAAALTAGLAWAFTDAVTRRIIVFWVKAAGPVRLALPRLVSPCSALTALSPLLGIQL